MTVVSFIGFFRESVRHHWILVKKEPQIRGVVLPVRTGSSHPFTRIDSHDP
ncbi:hypothetical protein HanRHA438_Chr13g0591731 [Helianthus annuus]|nr:hypothetical protein HanRHA438_Chr13g0591731 [Helianthus annuus]